MCIRDSCGDGEEQVEYLKQNFKDKMVVGVRGNCDWGSMLPCLLYTSVHTTAFTFSVSCRADSSAVAYKFVAKVIAFFRGKQITQSELYFFLVF